MDHLVISEDFYSIQCEGISTGAPAYFVRLKDCNLSCGFSKDGIKELKDRGEGGTTSGSVVGDLEANKSATWTCDSAPIWIFGHKKPFDYLINSWDDQDILMDVASGLVHIIWTGGEPALPRNQKGTVNFLKYFKQYCNSSEIWYFPYNEIETNGTYVIEDDLFQELSQINCSAKLANSGMSVEQRIVPDAIEKIKLHPNHSFKFVVSTEDDLIEAFDTYINPFQISLKNVCIMPGLDAQENFHERTKFSLELAKKYKVKGLTRLHISGWDKTTGV